MSAGSSSEASFAFNIILRRVLATQMTTCGRARNEAMVNKEIGRVCASKQIIPQFPLNISHEDKDAGNEGMINPSVSQ